MIFNLETYVGKDILITFSGTFATGVYKGCSADGKHIILEKAALNMRNVGELKVAVAQIGSVCENLNS